MPSEQLPTDGKGALYSGGNEYARLKVEQAEGFNQTTDPAEAYEMAHAAASTETTQADLDPSKDNFTRIDAEQARGYNKITDPAKAYEMAHAAAPKMKEALVAEAEARDSIALAADTKGMPMSAAQKETVDSLNTLDSNITDISGIFETGAKIQRQAAARHRDEADLEMVRAANAYDVGETMANVQPDKVQAQNAPALERDEDAVRKARDSLVIARYEAELAPEEAQPGRARDREAQAREKVRDDIALKFGQDHLRREAARAVEPNPFKRLINRIFK